MGVHPNHPFIGGCSIINDPFWDPPFMETPIEISVVPEKHGNKYDI